MSFRADLLDGRRIATADGCGGAILDRLRGLGAWVEAIAEPVLLDEDSAAEWARERAPLTALVFDAGASFADGGADGLSTSLELAWRAARAVATGALIGARAPAKLVFVAPRTDAGPHAEPARAALENLARTLSVEWARYAITAVTVTPGSTSTDAEVAQLVSYLVSEAGEYFSGCRFDLGTVAVAHS